MAESPIKGSCLCGEVAYEIRPPFLFFAYCHCSRCRKSSGSAHGANIFMKIDQFKWTKGEDVVKRFELPDAKYFCTGFCPTCGSSMPWASRNGKYILVPAGTLDDNPGMEPQRSIFWASRAKWYKHVSELPTFAEES